MTSKAETMNPAATALSSRLSSRVAFVVEHNQSFESDAEESLPGVDSDSEPEPDLEDQPKEKTSGVAKEEKMSENCRWILWIVLALSCGVTGALIVLLVHHVQMEPSTQLVENNFDAPAAQDSTITVSPTPVPVAARENEGEAIYVMASNVQAERPPAEIFPDPSVNYLYATPATARAVKSIGTGDFTMSVHVLGNEEFPQAQHPIFLSNRDTSRSGYYFLFGVHQRWRDARNKIPYMQIGDTNWIQYNHPDQPNILDGQWHHFVARRKGTTLSYYVDGELVVDITQEIIGSPIGSMETDDEQPLVLGYDLVNPSATRFEGEMQEMTVWNIALPIRDIATGLTSLSGDESGLIAYYPSIPLDEFGEISSHTRSRSPRPGQSPYGQTTSSSSTNQIPWP